MLHIKNLYKSYGSLKALQNISIQFKKGSCFGLIGPNGAGKSTLMKILSGIIKSDDGTILIERAPIQIGYVPQELCLEESVSAQQNLLFFGEVSGFKKEELHSKVEHVLSQLDLSAHAKQKVHTFSGGMKRRLNIGCALMSEPNIIILDEPTVGIDPESRKYILQLVQQMKQENKTIIYSTHYMEEAEKICDEIAFLHQGEIIKQTTMDHLLKSNANPEIFFQLEEKQEHSIDPGLFGDVQESSNGYLLNAENPIQTMEHVLNICKQHQLELVRLEMIQPRLEDVFFQLTGNQLQKS